MCKILWHRHSLPFPAWHISAISHHPQHPSPFSRFLAWKILGELYVQKCESGKSQSGSFSMCGSRSRCDPPCQNKQELLFGSTAARQRRGWRNPSLASWQALVVLFPNFTPSWGSWKFTVICKGKSRGGGEVLQEKSWTSPLVEEDHGTAEDMRRPPFPPPSDNKRYRETDVSVSCWRSSDDRQALQYFTCGLNTPAAPVPCPSKGRQESLHELVTLARVQKENSLWETSNQFRKKPTINWVSNGSNKHPPTCFSIGKSCKSLPTKELGEEVSATRLLIRTQKKLTDFNNGIYCIYSNIMWHRN